MVVVLNWLEELQRLSRRSEMALTPGSRLGPYEVTSLIGAGGMGEVFRARDSKLNREVALKILPEAFASDPERLARFRREAQVLASLNHPNIAAIYGFEESNGYAGACVGTGRGTNARGSDCTGLSSIRGSAADRAANHRCLGGGPRAGNHPS